MWESDTAGEGPAGGFGDRMVNRFPRGLASLDTRPVRPTIARMADQAKKRRGYEPVKAVNPADGAEWEVWISHQRMDAVAKRGMGHVKELAFIVPTVLATPVAVFEGLTRDEDEDPHGVGWLCYVAVPDRSFRADGTQAPPWADEVFVVFVNDDRVAYNWRWEKCDPAAPNLPVRFQERFKRKLL